ncbi:hypothetical protein [Planctomyces sp. SH-PL14]|uniref:hypothetical protein n=1 Tax=Planctomyces sp. SH-PL14 TaxID=1632864 RepID=UPI0009462CF8|nr:hypothetical protein [Planctomyces sp. SH-PL14]
MLAVIGVFLGPVVSVITGIIVFRQTVPDAVLLSNRLWWRSMILVAISSSSVLSASGWATYAVRSQVPFAANTVIVFAGSVVAWFSLRELSPYAHRYWLSQDPLVAHQELVVLWLPSFVIGILISAMYAAGSKGTLK